VDPSALPSCRAATISISQVIGTLISSIRVGITGDALT
jgi:hypothetical protein